MFRVDVDDAAVRRYLRDLVARVAAPAPAMADIARAMRNLTEDAFEQERSPFGDPWDELTAAYVVRPRLKAGEKGWGGRGGDAHPILQVTGGLAASVTSGSDAASAWIGESKLYGAIHQFGGTPDMAPGPAAIPARPYLPVDAQGAIPDSLRREIVDIVTAYLAA